MNKRVKIITTWLAAAVFLFALAINVKVTLDDPFTLLSDEAFASTTGSSISGGCLPVSTIQIAKKEIFNTSWVCDGHSNPPGIYITVIRLKDCWTGGTSQNCKVGSSLRTTNIAGQLVCSDEWSIPVICP
jgi:hypothetical protein